jgi:hypothetical protein
MARIDNYKSMLDSLTVNETINLECSDGIIREFKSSTISGSTQLHNSDGTVVNTNDFRSWTSIEEIFNTLE